MAKILVADDDDGMRIVLVKALSGPDRIILEARDGDEALAACAAESPDLVVLDARMPGTDGYAVCRRLRNGGSSCPGLLMLSGSLDTPPRDLAAGPDLFMSKPFKVSELTAAVEKLLRAPGSAPAR